MSNIITKFCYVLIKEHLNVNGTGQVEIHNSYTKKTVFLSQFMLRHDGEVTVRQYLLLAALMKMPRNTKNMAKFERVEQIISMVCTMKRIILSDVIGYLKGHWQPQFLLLISIRYNYGILNFIFWPVCRV